MPLLGALILAVLLGTAYNILDTTVFTHFIIGLLFGFILVRASLGFAGSVNKLYRIKSAYVASMLMSIFVLSAIFSAFLLYENETAYRLSIYPINIALILGGLMFGFGMAMSSCCATGSLTDLASGFSRASVTIFFFSMGVFIGFDTQKHNPLVNLSWISSPIGEQFQGGVFLPDLFRFDGMHGYLGAIIFTLIIASLFVYFAKRYELKYHTTTTSLTKTKKSLYQRLFVEPWSLHVSTLLLSSTFAFLLYYSHKGWSASSALGLWFGKLLMLFGFDANTLELYSGRSATLFSQSILSHANSVQNIGIVLGAVLALMLAGTFKEKFIAGLRITPKGFLTFAVGGFIMGLGTRLSNGCNVGALYTPIAEFSLSGWIYLLFVVIGGFAGNMFIQRYIAKDCQVV